MSDTVCGIYSAVDIGMVGYIYFSDHSLGGEFGNTESKSRQTPKKRGGRVSWGQE